MEKFYLIDNLCRVEEIENCALKGDLVCSCGNEFFSVFYNGKLTKGILASDLVRNKGTLFVEGRCTVCDENIKIFDSSTMGNPKKRAKSLQSDIIGQNLIQYGLRPFNVRVLLNYMPDKMKSDDFEEIFIEVKEMNGAKWKRIVEENK
ncbi:MAG: hypothetical protein CVV58_00100 [Tenericutes bacterium HGW-Tenericutes-3]|nr:MAG: hypothetical protein CVV58_00100 [Tenericutes bacterium HGW-Tenericutes-3]